MQQRTDLERFDRALHLVTTDLMLALLCIDTLLREQDQLGDTVERAPYIFDMLEVKREFIREHRERQTENAMHFGLACQKVYERALERADETFTLDQLEKLYHESGNDFEDASRREEPST